MRSTEFGTEETGVINTNYCIYCYRKGRFTEPDITLEQMVDKMTNTLVERRGLDEDKARRQTRNLIRQLRRWSVEDIEPDGD